MTLKVHESFLASLPQAFERMVADYRAALLKHHSTPVDPVTGEGASPPVAPHPIVEHALKRVPGAPGAPDDYVPDYEVIKPEAAPVPSLAQRKAILHQAVHDREMSARHAVVPAHKQRVVHRADVAAMSVPADKRSSLHVAHLAARDDRLARLDSIDEWAARCHAMVGDLDESTIEGFELPEMV